MRRGVLGLLLHLGAGVRHCDGEPCQSHSGKVDDVVAHKGTFVRGNSGLTDNLLKRGTFVVAALMNKLQFQIAGPEGNGFGEALCNKPGTKATETSQRDRNAVVRVKPLKFDRSLGAQLRGSPLTLFTVGQKKELAVGKNPVDVEQQQSDFPSADLS